MDRIKADVGYIDVLVNNAGVMFNHAEDLAFASDVESLQKKLWNAGTPEEFTLTFEINVKAVYYTTVAFLGLLDAGNKRHQSPDVPQSQVITVSSIGGERICGFSGDGSPCSVAYNASKSAAAHVGLMFSTLLTPWRIRSNVIIPGAYPSGQSI